MPSSALDLRRRAPLVERMDEPCTREELRACLRDIARLNRWFLAYRPVLHWLDAVVSAPLPQPLRILDVGCGYGDGLRRIEQWGHARGLALELTGLDLHPHATAIAAEASPPASAIRWVCCDVFAYQPSEPVHLIVSSQFTHHLPDDAVVQYLQWMERHAQLGWFIGDLSRAAIPYRLIRAFARLARLHPFVQYDAPVSVARAFVVDDWRRLCAAAGLAPGDVSLQAFKPARLCVARRKPL